MTTTPPRGRATVVSVNAAPAPQSPGTAAPADRPPQAPARGTAVSTAIIRLGVVLFALGVLSIVVSFVAPLFHSHLSNYFYIAAMACPLGLVICVIGALASGRRQRD